MVSTVKTTRIPPMTTAERNALANAPSGTIIFNTTDGILETTEDDGSTWIGLAEGAPTSKAYAEMYFTDNATETVITTPGTAVKIAGTYNVDAGAISDFTHVNGVLTYTGTDTKLMKMICPLSLTFNLATDTITTSFFKNGVEISNSKSSQDTFLGSTSPAFHNNILSATTEMSTNDTIEVRISTESITNNVTVQRLNFIIEDFSAGASSSVPKVTLIGLSRKGTGVSTPYPVSTPTDIVEDLAGTNTFAANSLTSNSFIEYKASGSLVGTGTGDNGTISLNFGRDTGNFIYSFSSDNLASFSGHRQFEFTFRVNVRSDSTVYMSAYGTFGSTSGNHTPIVFSGLYIQPKVSWPIDTTLEGIIFATYETDNASWELIADNVSIIHYEF